MRTKSLLLLFLIFVMAPGSMLWATHDGFTEHAVSTSADGAESVYAVDVDGDGDMDVLSASFSDDKIAWYENDGSETFTEHTISTSADGSNSVHAADVDGDGDLDVLSASDELDWHDNPEMAPMGSHISMYFSSIIESSVVPMTSDLRQTMDHLQVWDGEISGSGLTEPVELSWHVEKVPPGDIAVNMIDLNTRSVLDLAAPDLYLLGDLDDRYSRQVKILAGDPEQVALAVDEILSTIPEELSLDGNYPNPFNPVTTIRYGLPEPRNVRVTVVNILGQEITELVNGWKDIGRHEVVWQGQDQNGRAVASGMYFTVLSDGNKIIVQKMLLLK